MCHICDFVLTARCRLINNSCIYSVQRENEKTMVLLDSLKSLIKLCQFFGLAPFAQSKKNPKWKQNRTNATFSIAFLVIIGLNFLLCLIFNGIVIDHNESGLIVAIYTYSIIIICVHAFVVLAENFYKRNQHIKLFNLFVKLELILKQYHEIGLDFVGVSRFLHRSILCWALGTFGLSGLNILVLIKTRDANDFYFFVTYALPSFISKLSYIYSMVLVNMLSKNTDALIMFMRSLDNDAKHQKRFEVRRCTYRRSRRHENNLYTIEFLRKCQILIWKASSILNHTFYWSLSIGLLNEFSVLIFNCFFFMQLFKTPPEAGFISILSVVSLTIMNLFNIIYITSTCGNAVQAVIFFYKDNEHDLNVNVFS